jgi:hypothetical protein
VRGTDGVAVVAVARDGVVAATDVLGVAAGSGELSTGRTWVSAVVRWTADALAATWLGDAVSLGSAVTFVAVAATATLGDGCTVRCGEATSARATLGAVSAVGVRDGAVSLGCVSALGASAAVDCAAAANCCGVADCRATCARSGCTSLAAAVWLTVSAGVACANAPATAAGVAAALRGAGVGAGSACATGVGSTCRRAGASALVAATLEGSGGAARGSA